MQSKKLLTRRRLLELRKLVIVTMVFLLSLSNFLPYSAQYAQANETPSLSDLELTQDVDGEERKEVEKGATFTFNVNALIPEDGSNEGTLTILNQVDKQLTIENVEVVVNEEESDLEATVEGQDVSLDLTPEQLDTVAGQHVTMKITAAFQDEAEAGTEIENVAEAFINGELAEKAEPVTVALLADAEATSEEETTEEEAQQEEENAGEESSEEEQVSEEEQSSEEEAEGGEESNEVSVKDTAEARIAATDGQWLTHKFDEFSGNTFEPLFAADGAAGIPDGANFIRLTPAETLQSGAVFNKNAACPTNEYSFSTGFSFQMSGQSPEGPSDGLTFTLQTGTASQNSNGGGLGYYGIQPSFAVKYDTFLNTVYNDPSENYIGLAVDGSVVNQPGWYTDLNTYNTDNSTNFVLSDGTRYYTWIDYDGLNQNVQVRLGTSPDRGSSNLVLNVDNIDLSGIFNGQPYHAGFTASTGLPNYENHDIYNWYFIDDYSPIATLSPEGGSKQAPSDLELTIEQGTEQGEHNVIITLLDPLGNPVSGASLDELTATAGELTGPNGESVTELVSDEDGKVHAVLKNANPTQDITISATTGCFNVSDTIEGTNEPLVVAEKSVSPEGDVFVGDELTYEVTVKNEGGDVAADTVIEDAIPEGTEYVPGSMKIVYGPNAGDLTDANDDDAGQFDSDKVIINIGEVPNTTELEDGITVQFKVKALSSHVGESVVNKAVVSYKNAETDEEGTVESNEVTNEVIAGEDIDACANPVALVNGSFEEPPYSSDYATGPGYFTIDQELVPGWQTTDSYKVLEIFNKSLMDRIAPGSPQDQQGLKNEVPHGQQMAELNSKEPAQLYQDVETTPGQEIHWRLAHKGRLGDDTMVVKIGSADVAPKDLPTIETITTGKDEWKYYSGTYTVPADQTVTRFGFEAVSSAGGNPAAGNFLDDIFLGTEPCVVAEKSVSPEGEVFEGDELTYEVTVKNNGGDVAANTVIEDAIPEGTEFVPGSMKILNGPKKGDLTDENDDDAGHFDGDKVVINVGEVPNATELEEGITVQFKVKALSSHVGETVVNKATVGYKNLLTDEDGTTETNEVSNEIVEGEDIDACANPVALVNGQFDLPEGPGTYDNSVAGGGYYYADTVPGWETTDVARTPRGIIQIMDPARPSTIPSNAENLENLTSRFAELNADSHSMLYQELPTVPGQTIYWRLDHRAYTGVDTMSVNIGPVTPDPFNTTPEIERISTGSVWETYSGSYTVPAGQTVTRFGFKAISTSTGALAFGNYIDNTFLGTEPCVVAEKSVSPEGEVFEGDELTYEVTVKNNGGDIAADTVIEDVIPEGTEYVPGSMKILNGPEKGDLTDESDDDAGQFDGDKVIINIGDVPNTTELEDGITVQFKVKALSSHVGESVVNKATVGYKNLLTDEDKTTETNEVSNDIIEREDIDACANPVALVNGSFEEPTARMPGDTGSPGHEQFWMYFLEDEVPGWKTNASDKLIQIMKNEYIYQYQINPPHGNQYAELNAHQVSALYQDVETTPGQTIYWRLAHRGLMGVDTMNVQIGSADVAAEELPVIEQVSTDKTEWVYYSGSYTVPAGQTVTRFAFNSVDAAGGSQMFGNLLDDIFLGTEPCVVAEKSVSPEGEVAVGDELTYEVTIKNNGGDIAANTVFEDAIPEGTEYVPGSIKILTGPNAGDLTDADDNDAGHFDGDKVIINLGDLPNTTELPDGVTVQFKVKTISDNGGEPVVNKATVDYKNLLTDEDGSTETNEVETPVQYNAPKTESEKSAELLEKADGNTDADNPEVGDTLKYTIQTRNTVENSLITNLTIRDVIPEGLEYVPGTLKVNGEAVTDEKDDDEGHVVDGEVFGSFGDVTNTEWHTLEFQVIVSEGQAGNDIENVAVVDGDNLDEPDEPREEVKVYPREPKTESKKSAKNADDSKEHYEVGDTVIYTIEARNTVSDSLLENLKITDVLPEGLTFVEGSLKASDGGTGNYEDGKVTAEFGEVTDTEWRTVTFEATINAGYSGEKIKNVALVEVPNIEIPDEPETEIDVDPKQPKTESEKSAELLEKADGNTDADNPEVGDTLKYTIQTRNTIEDSLIANLTIRDVIPEGLEYVPGTLKVNGEAVTDENDDDEGHVVDGEVFASFGNVTDTEWHTLEFQVIVSEGQAGNDIENVAVVDGDNLDEPDEPREEVKVYPREPKLESKKSAKNADESKNGYEVGDTVVYTIETRNTVSDSLVEDLRIIDKLPEGLVFVEGSLQVSDGGTGNYEDGTVTGEFGDVTDTEWRTVTFEAKIESGFINKKIKNVATVGGGNIDEPDEPETEVDVDPKEPKLESKKSAKNADESKDGYEVGDTVVYTIESRNTVEDSIVEDFTIADQLPEGLAFVEGSLQVSDGGTGNYEDGTVTGEFGDVTDTEWRTVTFEAKIESGFINKTIKNVATVGGGNIDEPDEPETEVDVDPKEPKLESKKSAKNADESKDGYEVGDTVVYTIESRNTVEDSIVEDFTITDQLPEGLSFVEGSLQVSDGGTGNYEDGTVTGEFGDVTDTEWRTVTFEAKIESGFINKTIKNVATVGGGNIDEPDEPETEVDVDPKEPKLESKKSAKNADESKDGYEVGDTVVYTIESRNTVEDSIVEDFTITDQLPEGLAFVEGSLQVSDGGTGNYEDGTVTGEFGDVTDTEWRTVTFEAKIESGFINKTIKNVATVGGGNIDEPDEPETEVDVDPKEPKTESEKSAELLEKADGNTDADNPEVGDTLKYTIQTRNTIEDSLIANLTIRDAIPEGLEYVPGTLKVNGEAVTDEDDSDQGHVVDGEVFASFGDVTDTEWRTVEFHVIVSEGQAGKDIENVAVVDGDNIDEPDEPREEVKVYPREPKLESKKSAKNADENKKGYEVGDTVVYTIESRNTVSDSLLENLKITDVLPEGLTFVEGSLKVSDGGTGNYKDGTVTAEFGEVKDTDWRTVTFEATIDSGYSGEKIKNVAVVEVPNLEKPDEPETEVDVDPKDPKTESEKSAELLEKADGNTDADNPEVGDTLKYTIQTRNTVEDSLLANLTIRDAIPAGLEYVPGTLKVNGEAVTDENDDDKGHVVDGEVFASFGNVTDTEWHTVEFHVIVSEGQAGKDIENVAVVDGDNIDEPDEPREEVKVYPREPKLEYEKTAKNADEAKERYEAGDTVVYTIRARNTVSDSLLDNMTFTDELPEELTFVEGSLEASHGGTGSYKDGKVTAEFGEVKDTEWRTITFEATINAGYAEETIRNVAVIEVPNIEIPGEPDTEIVVDPKQPKLESKKSAKNADESKDGYEVGDTVVYTIEARNTVEDSLVEDLRITDQLPEGLAFVEGSLKVSEGGEGSFEDGAVTATFGNVTDTEWRTVTFEATIEPGFANKTVKNVATVDGGNIDDPDKPEQEVDVDPKQPKLESKKSAKNADESKDGYEVGDTVVYTIEARNTVEDSLVEDLRITDQLPEGLAFVEGSLKVSEGGEGSFEDGTVTATFGNVTDTEWHTVTFEATIEPGFANKTVKNVATVDGGNIDDPDKPEQEVDVDPKQPKLESKKSAKNADESKDGYEVGDTVVYTIEARNTVEDSLVEDLRITDQLPEGLAFVEGSLKVSEGGEGSFEDGTVTATFGNVTDIEWHTVTFEATIESGTSIKNVATVNGGNIDDPDKPEAEIDINEPPTPPTPDDGDDKEDPVDPTPGDKPEEPKPGNDGTDKPQVPPGKVGSGEPQDKGDATPGDKSPSDGTKLPKTATSTYNLLLIGASLIVLGAILWFVRRKKAA